MIKKLIFTFGIVLISAGFLFALMPSRNAVAAECKAQISFDAKPNPASFNQNLIFSGWVSLTGFEPNGTSNAGFCLKDGEPAKTLRVRIVTPGLTAGTGCADGVVYIDDIKLEAFKGVAYGFSKTIKPSDCGATSGQSINAQAQASVITTDGLRSLVDSSTIKINLTVGTYGIFACVAADGKYACSSGVRSDCADVPNNACQGKKCFSLTDSSKCGQSGQEPATHKACSSGACISVEGAGSDACTTDASCAGGVGGGGGAPVTTRYVFNLENPIGVTNFQDLINIIGKWIFNLAIPIAVIIIIYAGVLMLTAGGVPAKFQKGAKALWYAVLGLAVVLIGKGFVTLVQSILSLRNK